MLWSEFFIPTLKETPAQTEAVSHQLLLRSGLVNMLTAGVYSYLPLGLRVLRRIEDIVREEMNATGAQELFLPVLQPIELWHKTGRDQTLSDVMIHYEDKRGRAMCLGPTHEEVITDLVKNYVQSYRQLPLVLYQIQTKFRDEMRPRFGIVRACEFIMKDAYSFDRDEQGLDKNYQKMYEAYQKIFVRCGLDAVAVKADSGAMGGDVSHEFMVAAPIGEDTVLVCDSCGFKTGIYGNDKDGAVCPKCKKGNLKSIPAIELGHIFKLGTKYSKALGAVFLDENGEQKTIIMGCYGIGVSRLVAAIIETHYDKDGIIWPLGVAPFDIEILAVQTDKEILDCAHKLEAELHKKGLEVLVDDRDESAGRKFKDADLVGIPWRVTIGKKFFAENQVEIKERKSGKVIAVDKNKAMDELLKLLSRG